MTTTHPGDIVFVSSIREQFALSILNGLLAKHGSPCRTEVYLPDLRDSEDTPDEDIRHWREEKKEFEQRVEAYNRRAICRQAVKLADELILQLSLPAAP